MEANRFYELLELPFDYKALEPHISEAQLRLHHDKHHSAYVKGANTLLETIDKARKENTVLDMKATLKALSFNIGGHVLHNIFWETLAPAEKSGGGPGGKIGDALSKEFGSFERFKAELTQTALNVEGSGWAGLTYCRKTGRPIIVQIEKHNVNVLPTFRTVMVLDVWEHAYYLDYKNERAKFIEGFWNIINWDGIDKKFEKMLK